MRPFDGMQAAHETRMQLSGIACDRQLNKDEIVLHLTVCRFLNRYFTINDEHLRVSNEEPPRISDTVPKEDAPGSEFGLLPPNE